MALIPEQLNNSAALEKIRAKAQEFIKYEQISKSLFERDQFRKDIIFSLKKNQQRIGDKTISQWLLNYDELAGAKKNTSLERSKFMTQSLETDKLPEESKQCLLRLLEFYDNIKITVPITFINISEITLKEFLGELGIPLPEEKKVRPIPRVPVLEKPTTHRELPRKPRPTPEKTTEEISSVYKGKISPYERKRELTPDITPSFAPKEATVSKPQPVPKVVPEKKELPAKVPKDIETRKVGAETMNEYQIRTMKKDIEKAKKLPIPPKPEPKVRDNIVDLSGK